MNFNYSFIRFDFFQLFKLLANYFKTIIFHLITNDKIVIF